MTVGVCLGQALLSSAAPRLENGFSIGICAADHPAKLGLLLDIINREAYPAGFVLKSIIIVGSGLDQEARSALRSIAQRTANLILVEEPVRRGKAEAINRILEMFSERFLVLLNSDAIPEPGAIAQLLSVIGGDSNVGIVSASPVLEHNPGITGAVLRLIWSIHNECLLALNEKGENNHSCDELIAVRSTAIRKLRQDTVNDGAFLAGSAYKDGYSIQFCETAKVRIDPPTRIPDILRQRRRILYGHFQIRRIVGKTPRTMEAMLVVNPKMSLAVLRRTLRKSPNSMLALPIAMVGEVISLSLAILDTTTAKPKHVPWTRFGAKS